MFGKNLFYKEKIVTILFIAAAVIGAVIIFIFLSGTKGSKKIEGDFNEVLVASEYIAPSSLIKEESTEKQKISKSIFSDLFVEDFESVKSKITTEAIEPGEIISYSKLEGFEAANRNNFAFSSCVPRDKKAVTIPVIYYGNQGMLAIGDKIDIVSVCYSHNENEVNAKTILSEKEIVFISQNKNLKEKNNKNNLSDNQFVLLDLEDSSFSNDSSAKVIITLYLNKEETESLFKNYQSGVLFISVCSSKV